MDFVYDPEHLGADIKRLFDGAASALLVAPFITKAGLLPLIEVLAPAGRIDVVTRWDPREIRAGASDPMIIDDVEATGGTVRLVPRLHAKVYLAGNQALVGSANPTGPGLGFTTTSNIELVVATAREHPGLIRLFAVIEAVASRANREYAVQLVEYAAALPAIALTSAPDHAAGAADWIPQTMVPNRVVECYIGIADRDDYRADVKAIGAPEGLSEDAFRTYVGLALQQGFIGRIYRECEGLQQWAGIERMRQLLAEARISIDEDPQMIWNRILNWFKIYLHATESYNGGYTTKPPT
jgi:hypothetical protein